MPYFQKHTQRRNRPDEWEVEVERKREIERERQS